MSFDGAQIKKSHHSLINPAIIITLRPGSGGQGVPPLVSADGTLPHPGFGWTALSGLFISFSFCWVVSLCEIIPISAGSELPETLLQMIP